MTKLQPGPLAHINVFTPKAGMMDAFIETQLDGLPKLGEIPGLRGSWLYRANNDRNAILLAVFEDEEAHQRFMKTPGFLAHRDRLRPMIEGAQPDYYTLVFTRWPGEAAAFAAEA